MTYPASPTPGCYGPNAHMTIGEIEGFGLFLTTPQKSSGECEISVSGRKFLTIEPVGGPPVCRSTTTMSHAIIYLIFLRFYFASSLPQDSGGRQWWRNGDPTVEVEPKHRGGEKNKNCSFGAWQALLGPTLFFFENIFRISH